MHDRDEFDAACSAGVIGADEERVCLQTASELRDRLRDGDVLFDQVAWERLERAVDLGLRALPSLPAS